MSIVAISLDTLADTMKIAKAFHHESRYCAEEYDEEHVESYIKINYLSTDYVPPSYGFIAYNDEEEVVGIMTFSLANKLMNTDIIALEEVMYVDPAHRGQTVGLELNQACEELAKTMGCTSMVIGACSGIATPTTLDRLEAAGYHRMGVMLGKEL